ncbi:MAG TPA: FtsX-like permease family protein [Sedimentisphaerales bacterium]|nr:FtsX-like permease family protein [Sedimentisphaerales bacterium]
MLKFFLWFQYLRKKKIVLLSIAAVALSTSLLIVVSSLFTGFIRAFEGAAVQAIGEVVVTPPVRFGKYPLFIERLEQTGAVETATAALSTQGLLYLGKGEVRAVAVWGIEPVGRSEVTGMKQSLRRQSRQVAAPSFNVPGAPDEPGGFVGIGVVAEPDEKTDEYDFGVIEKDMIGRKVVLVTGTEVVSGAADDSSSNDVPGESGRFKRINIPFTISDIVFTGVYVLDKDFVYLPIEELQKKLYPDEVWPVADQVHIKLAPGVSVDSALAQIRGVWEAFASEQIGWNQYLIKYTDIETAAQMQSRYVAALITQMGVLLLIFGVVSLGVVLLVFCIFYMIVRLKQKDVAILKSCGAASGSVVLIFGGFGACVGVIGSAVGAILGYVITRNVNTIEEWIRLVFGLKLWKSSVYMFSRIPNEVNWNSALIIVLSAILAVVLGALTPAIIAARTRPVNVLRYE